MAGEIAKPVFGEPWASSGEKVAPELVKIQGGWIQEMMPFQFENWIQNRQDNAISYLMQKGIPEWSIEQECIANKTVVTYQGNIYMATVNSTGVIPTTVASWKRLNGIAGADGVVAIAGGGTGATTAATARTNLGLGTIATQDATAVAITGGTINATPIGATTPSTGAFTSVNASGNITAASFIGPVTGNVAGNATTVTNGVYTVGDQTIAGNKTLSGVTTVSNATASTTVGTGALVVAGGVGVTGALNVGGGITGTLTGNATTATTLATARTISITGGATGTATSFNGSANISIPITALDASLLSGTGSMSITGNAATATALQTPRTIAISGAATGTATLFDGSGNISIPVTNLNATNLTTGSVPAARLDANAVTKTALTGSAKLPTGTTGERDATPALGYYRYNTTTGSPEYWNGTAWITNNGTDLGGLVGTGPSQIPTNAIADGNYLPKSNAAMIGVPTAPTATAGTSTTQIATTAFVESRFYGEAIPASSDLDTYTRPGDYFCASNATAATIANTATPFAFALNVVMASAPGVIQTFTTYYPGSNRKIWQRALGATGSFGLWTRIYTEIDPPTDLSNLNLESLNDGQLAGLKNAIINGSMALAQRGVSFTNPANATYVADRWRFNWNGTGGGRTAARLTLAAGLEVEGNPYYLRIGQTATVTGQTVIQIITYLEDVRLYAGEVATVSFVMKRNSGAGNITSIDLVQNFGTSGSASVTTNVNAAQTITTAFVKYSFTVTVPSISGKTIGANSYLALAISFTNNGVFQIDTTNVQFEKGPKASRFERLPPGLNLFLCERYCQIINSSMSGVATAASQAARAPLVIRTPMRGTPTVTYLASNTEGNIAGNPTVAVNTNSSGRAAILSGAAGEFFALEATFLAQADF